MLQRRLGRLSAARLSILAVLWATGALAQTSTTYTYDAQGQVRTVARPGQSVTYAYDAAANRSALTVVAGQAALAASRPATLAERTSNASVDRPPFAVPSLPVDVVKLAPAPTKPPSPPISPLTGQPVSDRTPAPAGVEPFSSR